LRPAFCWSFAVQQLYFCTSKASKASTWLWDPRFAAACSALLQEMPCCARLLLRQYLYFCTSKASKRSTCCVLLLLLAFDESLLLQQQLLPPPLLNHPLAPLNKKTLLRVSRGGVCMYGYMYVCFAGVAYVCVCIYIRALANNCIHLALRRGGCKILVYDALSY
jgi:hypothetical protein